MDFLLPKSVCCVALKNPLWHLSDASVSKDMFRFSLAKIVFLCISRWQCDRAWYECEFLSGAQVTNGALPGPCVWYWGPKLLAEPVRGGVPTWLQGLGISGHSKWLTCSQVGGWSYEFHSNAAKYQDTMVWPPLVYCNIIDSCSFWSNNTCSIKYYLIHVQF